MKYRPHREMLADSMAEMIEIDGGRDGLIKQLRAELAPYPDWDGFPAEVVHVDPYGGDDPRIGWKDVHIVTIDGYGVMGFIEGPA